MKNDKYVVFNISGIKHNSDANRFSFTKDAECILDNDRFISKIVMSADISEAIFYLYDTLEITEDNFSEIIDYLSVYLGNMMIALLKHSTSYSNVLLKPTISFSKIHLLESNAIKIKEHVKVCDHLSVSRTFSNGDELLKKWIQDVDTSNYTNKYDKYDILFLLLQGEDIVQKYMAMYAYLMSLVKEIYSLPRESQKQVVKYISNNCSRVNIKLVKSFCTRPGAKPNEVEDQFTALRNKIAHPSNMNSHDILSEKDINQLASIICCAIEDIKDTDASNK